MELTAQDVARKVQAYLVDRRPAGVELKVVEEAIQKFDYWWRVPLRPNWLPSSLFPYYEQLADIEMELYEKENLDILFATEDPVEVAQVA